MTTRASRAFLALSVALLASVATARAVLGSGFSGGGGAPSYWTRTGAVLSATTNTDSVVLNSATGGSKGNGTINASGLYVNGASVLTSTPAGFTPYGTFTVDTQTQAVCAHGAYLYACGVAKVMKIEIATRHLVTTSATAMSTARGICYDSATDTVWVAGGASGAIYKFDNSLSLVTSLAPGGSPQDICSDGQGYVWCCSNNGHTYKINVSTAGVSADSNHGGSPNGIASDGASHVYVTNTSGNTVFDLAQSTASTNATVSVDVAPFGICVCGAYAYFSTYATPAYIGRIVISSHTFDIDAQLQGNSQGITTDGTNIYVVGKAPNCLEVYDQSLHNLTDYPFTNVSLSGTSVAPANTSNRACYDGVNAIWVAHGAHFLWPYPL